MVSTIHVLPPYVIQSCLMILGGGGVAEQIADLKRGSEIVVCTPGRMIEILCMQQGRLCS
jgi:ATP-dependent RNA helicase DDX46/PRP5